MALQFCNFAVKTHQVYTIYKYGNAPIDLDLTTLFAGTLVAVSHLDPRLTVNLHEMLTTFFESM
jgi:hypothetical protein